MKKLKSIIIVTLIATLLIIAQTGCGSKDPVSKTSYYLDTICEITINDMSGMNKDTADAAIDDAFGMCSDYEKLLSKTIKGSEIYKINHANGKPVEVSDDTIEVIKKGIYYGNLSGGLFDITIGKVSDLWDFHSENPKVPKASVIAEAIKSVNYKNIVIKGNTVTLKDPKTEIDLGGIAKGYIGDKLTKLLIDKGVTSGVINLGGNIIAIGGKTDTKDFKIGIERPYSDRTEIIGSVPARNKTVVTSGIYERCFTVNGKVYHHILDVKTGYPVNNDVEAVTIVGDINHSVDCDGLSTTCLLLGVKDGKKLIESIDGVEAIFIDKDSNITYTKGMVFNPGK